MAKSRLFFQMNVNLPQTVWHKFTKSIKVAKFSFSSRSVPNGLDQSPKEFEFVGSNDCQSWTVIGDSKYQTTFTGLNQEMVWEIPPKARKRYKCYGIKVYEVASGGNVVAIKKMKMWREGENIDTAFLSHVLRDSTPRFVGPSVHPSVHRVVNRSVTLFFLGGWSFSLTSPAQMMK